MPELEYAVLCEHAKVDAGMMGYAVAAGLDTLFVSEVPTGINLALLLRVTFTRNECGRPHRAEVFVQDEDGQRLVGLSTVMLPDWREHSPPGWTVNSMSGLNFGVPILRYGLFSIEILLNDTSARSIPFRVVQPAQQPQ